MQQDPPKFKAIAATMQARKVFLEVHLPVLTLLSISLPRDLPTKETDLCMSLECIHQELRKEGKATIDTIEISVGPNPRLEKRWTECYAKTMAILRR